MFQVQKKAITAVERTELRRMFGALDADGGGEVEFDEFITVWKMVADDERSIEGARPGAGEKKPRMLFWFKKPLWVCSGVRSVPTQATLWG